MIRAGAIAIGLGLALGAPDAAAFSDPGLFAAPALDGGGAGHQFTGAPGDGLACDVCHRGGPAPAFAIEGVPDELEPGTRYQVVVRWTDPAPHALQLELVDDAGASPAIALPPTAPPETRCDDAADPRPATYRRDLGARAILGVEDCGARALAFTFTAPDAPTVYFAAAVVRSNGDGTADGDGVGAVRRALPRRGDAVGGCAAGGPPSSAVVGLLALARRAAGAHSSARPAVAARSRA